MLILLVLPLSSLRKIISEDFNKTQRYPDFVIFPENSIGKAGIEFKLILIIGYHFDFLNYN
jgi:hypothetical protein